MVAVEPGGSRVIVLVGGRPGLAAVGFEVADQAGVVVTPRTTVGVVESPAGSGVYMATYVAPATPGVYLIQWDLGITPDDPSYHAVEELHVGATLDSIGAKLAGAQVVTVSPVASTGDVDIRIGADYFAADGRALEWADQFGTWPDLTGAAIQFRLKRTGTDITTSGVVVTPSGASKRVRVEVASLWTVTLRPQQLPYEVWATLANGHAVMLADGTATIST